MNSVELVKSICKDRKIPISRLEKDCGFGNGYIGQLKNGTFPSDRLALIAKYLDISIEYLMTGESIQTGKTNALTPKDEKDIAKDLAAIREKLTNKEDGPASFNGENISDDSAELLLAQMESMLRTIKVLNKQKYNPNKNKNKK